MLGIVQLLLLIFLDPAQVLLLMPIEINFIPQPIYIILLLHFDLDRGFIGLSR